MKTKHTKAPWLITTIQGEDCLMVGGGDGSEVVADIRTDWPGEVVEANARLIAAAPELLEACEGLLQIVQDCMPSCKFEDHGCHEIVKLASEAIATAKGTDGWRVLQENFKKMTPEQALDWWGLECVDYEGDE